jgi:hypothetical protein
LLFRTSFSSVIFSSSEKIIAFTLVAISSSAAIVFTSVVFPSS